MAQEYPLNIDSGEGLKFIFYYRQKTTHASLIPAGSTASMTLHDAAGIAAPVELTTESGHIVLDSGTGRFEVTIPRVEAAALQFRQANYKTYLHRPDGTYKKLLVGVARKI